MAAVRFRRSKGSPATAPTTEVRPGGKNRPTPKRSVAQAANKRPLVGGSDRKSLSKASRDEVRTARLKQRQALLSGDDRNLPARDAGPERRFVRDYIDARLSAGELLLPLLLIFLVLGFTGQAVLQRIAAVGMYGLVLAVLMDAVYLRWRLSKLLTAKFAAVPRGMAFYAVTRTLQMRRWRLPRPQVKRGDFPT